MKVTVSRQLSLAAYLGLIAFGMAWSIHLADLPPQQISISLLFFAPLLLPLRGILHGRDKAIVWGTLVSLIYLVHGGMIAWADAAHRYWGLLELTLAVIYLVSGSYFIRWRAQANATNS